MKTTVGAALLMAAGLVAGGCGQTDMTTARPAPAEVVDEAALPDTHLPTPFTADEIRLEWIEGFELVMRRSSPDGDYLERWRVVSADDEGVEIEFAAIDGLGETVGEPRRQRSGWEELRNHAVFAADRASRTWVVETTPLGELEGWLYSVREPEGDTVAHYFFAESLPGAPVRLRVVSGDEAVLELVQIERFRPSEPGRG